METVKIECQSCGGTGLYHGFAEPEGVAVVCSGCNGTGCSELRYTPFERRKGKRGIHTVRRSRGALLALGVGPTGGSITYKQFQAGKYPS